MQLDDTDPHRRNLVVTSLAFIFFFLSGGRLIDGGHIKLGLLDAELTKPGVALLLAVVMLAWFGFRYWQKSPNIGEKLNAEIK